MKKILLIFFFIFFAFGGTLKELKANSLKPLSKQNLYLSNKKVALKSPLVKDENIIYIPLRDLCKTFGNTLKFSEKRQEYDFKISNYKTVSFAEYWPKYTFKGQYHFWTGLPLRYKNRIYVPLKDATSWFDGQLRVTKESAVSNSTAYKKTQGKTKLKSNVIWELNAKPVPVNYLPIPRLSKNENLSIKIGKKNYNLSRDHRMINGQLWLNFQPLLRQLGYQIQNKNQGYIAIKNKQRLVISSENPKVSLKKINNTWYSPIKETAIYLGWIPYWKYKKIYFLNKIDQIRLVKNNKGSHIEIKSKFPLRHSQITLVDSKKFYIDLRNSFFDAESHNTYPQKSVVNQITLGNHPLFNRLVINSQEASSAKLSSKQQLLSIHFPATKAKSYTKKPTQKPKKRLANVKKKAFKSFRRKTIAIDPGHGGIDPGAVLSSGNKHEKHFVWDISEHLKKHLEKKGYKVVMLREWDKNPSLWQRVDKANKSKSDALISVHLNSFTSSEANGTETYYYKYQDKVLARYIHDALTENLKLRDNGLKKAKMYILNYSKMPGVLIEPAYLTHNNNFEFIQSPQFKELLSKAIEKALNNYFQSNP